MNRYLHYAPLLDNFIEKYNEMRSTATGNNMDGGKTMLVSYICKKLKEYTGTNDNNNNYAYVNNDLNQEYYMKLLILIKSTLLMFMRQKIYY